MNSQSQYYGHRFPPEIINHTVWLYHRFTLSFRDIDDLLAERGIIVSYETVRQWCLKFDIDYAQTSRKRRGRLGDMWFIDEVFVKSMANASTYGVRSIKTAKLSIFWFKAGETSKRICVFFASCLKANR